MRRLIFGTTKQDEDRFDILYGGLCVSPKGVGRTELNTFNGLLAKLEEIAKPLEIRPGAHVKFQLGDEGGDVLLEESEYKFLNEMHAEVRWVGSESPRKAAETYTWLDAIPNEKLKAIKNDTPPEA